MRRALFVSGNLRRGSGVEGEGGGEGGREGGVVCEEGGRGRSRGGATAGLFVFSAQLNFLLHCMLLPVL